MNNKTVYIDHFHKHEALDRVHVIAQMVEQFLSEHPVVMQNEKISQNVEKALDCLANCYSQIARIEVERKGKIF